MKWKSYKELKKELDSSHPLNFGKYGRIEKPIPYFKKCPECGFETNDENKFSFIYQIKKHPSIWYSISHYDLLTPYSCEGSHPLKEFKNENN